MSLISYASRTGTRRNLTTLREHGWRLLVSATGCLRHEGFPYALDNGAWTAFQKGQPFNEQLFKRALTKLGKNADWVVVPDIVGGGLRSLELSLRWLPTVLENTQRALLAVQDGIVPNDVRSFLGERVGLFVGGGTEWKEKTIPEWAETGRAAACWVHVGRVNTVRRIALCVEAGATSIDGTSASRYSVTVPKLDAARRKISAFPNPFLQISDIQGEPHPMTTELAPYRQQAGDLDAEHREMVATLRELDTFTVASDEDSTFAADMIREVKAKHKELDERRKEVTQPLNTTIRTINGWFKPALDALESAEKKLKSKVALYMQECEARAREAIAAAAAAKDAQEATLALAAAPPPAAMPQGVSMRKVWKYRIVDESAVPARFCSPDPAKIDAELRGRVRDEGTAPEIPGVEFYQESSMTVRR